MTILGNDNVKTIYNLDTNQLSRAVDNTLCKVQLEPDATIQKVHRLAHLDNESFKLLASFQKELSHEKV